MSGESLFTLPTMLPSRSHTVLAAGLVFLTGVWAETADQLRDRVFACASTVTFPEISPVYSRADRTLFSASISYDAELCTDLNFQGWITRSEASADFNPTFRGVNPSFRFGLSGSDEYIYNIARGDMVDQGFYDFGGVMFLGNDPTDEPSSIGAGNEASFTVTIISPDADKCSQSINFPEVFPDGQPGSVDIPSSNIMNFLTTVRFATTGVCGPDQYLDLTLTNSNGASYVCDRVTPPSSGNDALLSCGVPAGSMSTLVTWRFESAQTMIIVPRASDSDMLYLTTVPTFTVTHTEDSQATGGMRRRQRQVQAGLLVPSDVQCKSGHEICPVPGRLGSWECLDTANLLDACGGCPLSGGRDCTDIPGIARVKCQVGRCVVQECDDQHKLTRDRSSCVPRTNSIRWSAI